MQTSDSGSHKKGSKKVRTKKMSTRVDLTAMVDLGFLLITFFMLATTMNKPKTMEVNKPAKEEEKVKEPPDNVIGVLPLCPPTDHLSTTLCTPPGALTDADTVLRL